MQCTSLDQVEGEVEVNIMSTPAPLSPHHHPPPAAATGKPQIYQSSVKLVIPQDVFDRNFDQCQIS